MRTCLNGYWMGNRRPTNTHILRSALRNSQTKKNAFNNARHRGNGFQNMWHKRKKQTCSLRVCTKNERRFPWKQSRQVSMCGTTYTENLSLRILDGKRRAQASTSYVPLFRTQSSRALPLGDLTNILWVYARLLLPLAMDGRRNETLSC